MIFIFEELVSTLRGEITFYLGNLGFLVIETEFAVELLQENIEHRINAVLRHTVEFLLNVEQHCFGRDSAGICNVSP